METWLQVELAATDAWVAEGVVPAEAAEECGKKASVTVDAVQERERTTGHDVAAFVDVVADSIGEQGRWLHYGLTSSDVLDTALAVQFPDACDIVLEGARAYRDAVSEPSRRVRGDPLRRPDPRRARRADHLRACGWRASRSEADRNLARLRRASRRRRSASSPERSDLRLDPPDDEGRPVMEALGLATEDISTQVVPRDRHAGVLAGGRYRGRRPRAVRTRDPQPPADRGPRGRGTVRLRLAEGLLGDAPQRNPIPASGSAASPGCCAATRRRDREHRAWHRARHLPLRRRAGGAPDATIVLDYMQHIATRIVEGMTVHTERMRENIEMTHGALFSQRALTALVESGMTRDDAYRVVQESAQRAWDEGTSFRELIADKAPDLDTNVIFNYDAYLEHVPEVMARLDALD